MRAARRSLMVLALMLTCAAARAEGPTETGRGWYAFQAGGGFAPILARVQVSRSAAWALPQRDGLLWQGREVELEAALGLSPATADLRLQASIIPIAFLELRAGYGATGFFGTFGTLWRAPSRRAPFGDADIEDDEGRPAMLHELTLAPALRARVGRLIVRNQTELALVALSRGRGWYRLPDRDTLVAPRDLILTNELVALVEAWRGPGRAGLLLGPAAEVTWAARADLTRVRVGGMAAFTWSDRLGALSHPRLFAWAGVAARDRNREGEAFGIFGMSADLEVAP